jgi:hypothetical protein
MDMSPPKQAARKRSLCSPAHSETGGQRPMEVEEAELPTPPPILREPQRSTKTPQKDPPREAHNAPPLQQQPRQTEEPRQDTTPEITAKVQRAKRTNSEHLSELEQQKRSKDLDTATMDVETHTIPRQNPHRQVIGEEQGQAHVVTPGQQAVSDAAKIAQAKAKEVQSPVQPAVVDAAKITQAKAKEVQSPAQTAAPTPDRVDETEL